MADISKVVFFDEYLETKVGHYYEYDKTVIQALSIRNIDSVIYAKSTVDNDIVEEFSCVPHFKYNPYSKVRKIKIIGAFLYRFLMWYNTILQVRNVIKKEAGDEVLFFVPNIFWYNIIPYSLVFGKTNYKAKLLFRTSINDVIDVGFPFKQLIPSIYTFCVNRLRKNPNVSFVTDSEVIAQEFVSKFQERMDVLPIPHVFEVAEKQRDNTVLYRLYLPGGARVEKGIVLVAKALQLLDSQNHEVMKCIQLAVQFFGDKEKEELDACASIMRKLSCSVFFYGKLSSEEYKDQFSKADIILVPYLNDKGYKARTSGVLAEAIATAKPFITAKGSWMDTQVKRYNTGYAILDSSVEELAQAIVEVIDNYDQYKLRAEQAKESWLNFHSKEQYGAIFCTG